MISVEEARNIVKEHTIDLGTESINLTQSIGRTLSREVLADRDFPPFDRITMDGIAFCFDSYQKGQREFLVESLSLAGEPVKQLSSDKNCIEIMTGSVLAEGCDAMVRYEDLEFIENEKKKYARVLDEHVFRWKNVHRQGSDSKKGAVLVRPGVKINSALISILATVGLNKIVVRKLPQIAIISTGDELVDINKEPEAHQIRKSNTITIKAELNKLGIRSELFHLADRKELIKDKLKKILTDFDAIILSGGVSKGKVDYVPDALAELGVKQLFHRVAQRPGKPFWFGVFESNKPIFAFPGNPISTFTCFKVYFMDWLASCKFLTRKSMKATLMQDFSFKPNLGYFLQVKEGLGDDAKILAFPQTGNGSGDLANLSKSDAIIFLPAGSDQYKKGGAYEIFRY